jgi:transposase
MPASAIADLFDMHINTAVRWVQHAKRDWIDYVTARAEDQGVED